MFYTIYNLYSLLLPTDKLKQSLPFSDNTMATMVHINNINIFFSFIHKSVSTDKVWSFSETMRATTYIWHGWYLQRIIFLEVCFCKNESGRIRVHPQLLYMFCVIIKYNLYLNIKKEHEYGHFLFRRKQCKNYLKC